MGHVALPSSPAPKGLDLRRARAEKAERAKSCKILRAIENYLPLGEAAEAKNYIEKMYEKACPGHLGDMTIDEMDKFVRDVLKCHALFNCKPVLQKGLQMAKMRKTPKKKVSSAESINAEEFRFCLLYVRRYFELWLMFQLIDKNGDRCVSLEEFVAAVPFLQHWGSKINEAQAREIFMEADADGGGFVLFDEFAAWAMAQGMDFDGNVNLSKFLLDEASQTAEHQSIRSFRPASPVKSSPRKTPGGTPRSFAGEYDTPKTQRSQPSWNSDVRIAQQKQPISISGGGGRRGRQTPVDSIYGQTPGDSIYGDAEGKETIFFPAPRMDLPRMDLDPRVPDHPAETRQQT